MRCNKECISIDYIIYKEFYKRLDDMNIWRKLL